MTAPDLKPCPFCKGGITSIEGKGQIWRGVNGYSAPQWYQLNHYGKLSETDDFPRCNVEFRCRTEAEAITAWNTRATPAALSPEVQALVDKAADEVWFEITDSKALRWTLRKDHIHHAIEKTFAALRGIGGGNG